MEPSCPVMPVIRATLLFIFLFINYNKNGKINIVYKSLHEKTSSKKFKLYDHLTFYEFNNFLNSDDIKIQDLLVNADLVIGAVLIPGTLAPKVITANDLKIMQSGSVIVDVSIDRNTAAATFSNCPS